MGWNWRLYTEEAVPGTEQVIFFRNKGEAWTFEEETKAIYLISSFNLWSFGVLYANHSYNSQESTSARKSTLILMMLLQRVTAAKCVNCCRLIDPTGFIWRLQAAAKSY